jgi:multidrug efflux pump subunit AcrA (membrane-fusion protein)
MRRAAAAGMTKATALFAAAILAAVLAEGLRSQAAEPLSVAQVIVVRAKNACFSAAVRVTGYLVARQEVVVPLQRGEKVVEVLAAQGDDVTAGQIVARVERQTPDMSKPGGLMKTETVALKAPAAGIIIDSTAFVGATESPLRPEPLFRIAIDNEIELEAEVPSIYVPELSSGQTVQVILAAGSEVTGRLRLVPISIDDHTQLGRARISLERNPHLRYGMFAKATISAERSCGISVPNTALTYRTGGTSVQIVRNDVIETRSLQIGIRSDSATEVRRGLKEGDLVVANAGTSLRDGDRVKPVEAADAATGRL